MNFTTLLFGFQGRIRRTHYWLGAIGAGVVLGVVGMIIAMVFGGGAMMAAQANNGAGAAAGAGMGIVGGILYLAVLVAAVWISLALQIKRWHDRDKGAIWVLINFIPVIGGLWALVECGFLDGTAGPNKFGPSPKGIEGPAAPAPAVS
ncbi:MAG: DUF805 domain-containing protein [Caulobacteraceae bacterium]|nr:DUF805 domain-containing protein [Caulobacteraceae bacterium]